MNVDTIIDAIGDIDEELYDRSAEHPRAAAPKPKAADPGFGKKRVLRIAAVAAAALLIFGAVFAAIKLTAPANGPVEGANVPVETAKDPVEPTKDPVEAWKEPVTVPADAVFAPVRNPDGLGSACRDGEMFYGYKSAFENADAVCLVTIENWLSECFICSFFEASVDKVYKGELPDKIVIRQEANSNFSLNNTPLFTYGNKLLVFLTVWDSWDEGVQQHENAYALMDYGTGYLFYAQDNAGNDYLIDQMGDISYKTRQTKEAVLRDQYSGQLVGELIEYISKQDSELAKSIELFTHDTDRMHPEPEGRPMTVLRFRDMDDLLTELSKG